MGNFEFVRAKTTREAVELLSKHAGEARIIAGGTDLLVAIRGGAVSPKCLVDIRLVRELGHIDFGSGGLRIGALATHHEIATHPIIQEMFAALAQASSLVGSRQVRNVSTVSGNLCHASPAAETAPPLLVLGAKVKAVGPGGERVIPLEDFFLGPGQTALGYDELVTEIAVPDVGPHTGSAYLKLSPRRAMDLAIVGVAVLIRVDSGRSTCIDCRIALGAAASTPLRARAAEQALAGQVLTDSLIEKVAQLAAEESEPISDVRASAEYRRDMVGVLTGQAVRQARERAAG